MVLFLKREQLMHIQIYNFARWLFMEVQEETLNYYKINYFYLISGKVKKMHFGLKFQFKVKVLVVDMVIHLIILSQILFYLEEILENN